MTSLIPTLFVLFITAVLKTKVQSFRSSFARELREEKECCKSGAGKRVSQVYTYAGQLSFLRPHLKIRALKDNTAKKFKTNEQVYFHTQQSLLIAIVDRDLHLNTKEDLRVAYFAGKADRRLLPA